MAPFDRPYVTFYWSAIVSIALYCTILELLQLTSNNIVTFKSRLRVIEGHWKRHLFTFYSNYGRIFSRL